MKTSCFGVLLLIFGTNSIAEAEPAQLSQAERVEIAKQVITIFKNKCAKCHGPEGVRTWKKPNADFDYVLDLEKLGSNPEMVVRGDPNESKLFFLYQNHQSFAKHLKARFGHSRCRPDCPGI